MDRPPVRPVHFRFVEDEDDQPAPPAPPRAATASKPPRARQPAQRVARLAASPPRTASRPSGTAPGTASAPAGQPRVTVDLADRLEFLRAIPSCSLDGCVTDPPYGLGDHPTPGQIVAYLTVGADLLTGDFMGKDWAIPPVAVWCELYRALKPGAHVVAFAGCYDEETEVLTRGGWVPFPQVTGEEEFASLNPTTNMIEWQRAKEVVNQPHHGPMVRWQSNKVDLLVTPNHKMYVSPTWKNSYELVRADECTGPVRMNKTSSGRNVPHADTFTLPGCKKHVTHDRWEDVPARQIPMSAWLPFFGLYLAEGSTTVYDAGSYAVQICHFNRENVQTVADLLKPYFEVHLYPSQGKLRINDKQLALYLRQFGKAWEKFIPDEMKELAPAQLRTLWYWYMCGDGHDHRVGFTSSPRLRDDWQEVALYMGISADWYVRKPKERNPRIKSREIVARRPHYAVTFNHTQSKPEVRPTARTSGKACRTVVPAKEWAGRRVYCVELERHHTLYVRRGGKAVWCGNTRTHDVMSLGLRMAGFELRDTLQAPMLMWCHGEGFPKSHNLSKALDKMRPGRHGDALRATAWIRERCALLRLTARDLDRAAGTNGMGGHWTSTGTQPEIPSLEQWRAVLHALLCPDDLTIDAASRLRAVATLPDAYAQRLGADAGPPPEWFTDLLHSAHEPSDNFKNRAVVAERDDGRFSPNGVLAWMGGMKPNYAETAPYLPEAQAAVGLGTALKPAWEPVLLFRKPLNCPDTGRPLTVAECFLRYGTGALAIDPCRVAAPDGLTKGGRCVGESPLPMNKDRGAKENRARSEEHSAGRWPPNLLLCHLPDCSPTASASTDGATVSVWRCAPGCPVATLDAQSGGASRFFPQFTYTDEDVGAHASAAASAPFLYCAKAKTRERNAGLDGHEIVDILASWDGEDRRARLRVDTGQSPPRVIDASGTLSSDAFAWSTWLFGNGQTTAPCLRATTYTTSMRTSSTTESRTLQYVLNSLTSANIPVASSATESSGSPAESAETTSPSLTITFAKSVSLPGAPSAASPTLLTIRGNAAEARCDHPTVKALALMRWLVRLVAPVVPGRPRPRIVDMHSGSGSTAVAALLEGVDCAACDNHAPYVAIARARLAHWAATVPRRSEPERGPVHAGAHDLVPDQEA